MTSNNSEPTENKDELVSSIDSSEEHPSQAPKTSASTNDEPAFGWSNYAERINGRFAMIGFIAILVIEALTQDSFFHWAGILQ